MIYLLILSLLVNAGLVYILVRFSKRLMQYDDLFDIVGQDLNMNMDYLNDMLNKNIMTNAPEILTFDRNLRYMKERMVEVVNAINEQREPRLPKMEDVPSRDDDEPSAL